MITRRRFLQGVGAAGVAVGLDGCTATTGAVGIQNSKRILVVVNIEGGYDWLNVMPPSGGTNRTPYETARPTLKIATTADVMTDLGGGIGLNKDLTGFDALHAAGQVAWIPGIGMNNPNLSHFVSTDLWGQGAAVPDGSGWLGRFADRAFAPTDVLRGITVTNDLPVMLRGHDKSFVSLSSATGYVFPASLRGNRLGSPWDAQVIEDAWGKAVTSTSADVSAFLGAGGLAGYDASAIAAKLFYDAQNGFGTNGTLPARTPSVAYPGDAAYPVKRNDGGSLNSSLSSQLKLIARMLQNGVEAQVFFARLSGWDTHSNEVTDLPNLQRALGGSISSFFQDLKAIPTATGTMQDTVMIMTWSEFGRRVQENQGGTDHGTAGLSFCVASGLHGGFYGGGYPSLAGLDGNGNMVYTTDFRSLYATVLERWLGLTPGGTDAVLGQSYPRLGFI